MGKKRTKRNQAEYPALDPKLNLRSRFELIDYDYIDQLTDKEKEWLNNFTEEFVNANLNHEGKKLHKTKSMKKDCYSKNNARNRCILTRAKAGSKIGELEEAEDKVDATVEDQLINKLDNRD